MQSCESSLGSFPRCLPTEAAERRFLCDLATVRPEIVSSSTCREGIEWRLDFPGNAETCSYADGMLVGASFDRSIVAGFWKMNDCVPAELCPARDAGTCEPRANADRPCDEDVGHFPFCRPTETEQRATLCMPCTGPGCRPDGGAFFRSASVCDGGVELTDVLTGFGPTHSCFYADGGLIGASDRSDTNTGPVHGVWSLADCVDVPLCP